MILKLMKNDALDMLRKDIPNNIDNYRSGNEWIDNYFEKKNLTNYYFISDITVPYVELIMGDSKNDYENSKLLYTALKDLNQVQASDFRLWAYMTHCTYWEYMNKRWPIDTEDPEFEDDIKDVNKIGRRYFFEDKPFVRNGIARLWWSAYLTFDEENPNNKFEYTEYFLSKQDIFASSTERTLARNRVLLLAALKELKVLDKIKREEIREYFARLNQAGGVLMLDALNKNQASELAKVTLDKVLNNSRNLGLFK